MNKVDAGYLLGLADELTARLDGLGRYVRDEAVRHGVDAEEGPEVSADYMGACLTVCALLQALEGDAADRRKAEALRSMLAGMALKTDFAIKWHTNEGDDE